MLIHILLVRKEEHPSENSDDTTIDTYNWSLSPQDINGVLDPNYCDAANSNNGNNADPSPILDTNHPRLALHYEIRLATNTTDGTNARLFPPQPTAWQDSPIHTPGMYVLVITTCRVDNMAYADAPPASHQIRSCSAAAFHSG